uniref:Protein kinase domain-containing protein n=1 Tax=viral metagenome TaxID=1070528 RepID=A0A6C0CSG8_9ZZZZ
MSSIQYTLKGDLKKIEDTFEGRFFFRKYVDASRENNELEIAKKLLSHSCPHCVRIYQVKEQDDNSYIDMELLAIKPYNIIDMDQVNYDVKMALEEMHLLQIIYIDLKYDNVGFSEIDKKWKIFDFNISGIADPSFTQWIEKPPYYYSYKKATKIYHQIEDPIFSIVASQYSFPNLLILDELMYQDFVAEINKK